MFRWLFVSFFLVLWFGQLPSPAQDKATAVVTYSATRLSLRDVFVITVVIQNEKVKQVSNFPEIADFAKSTTAYLKEKKNYIIKQYYKPLRKGEFELNNFILTINKKVYSFKGAKLFVSSSKVSVTKPVIGPDVTYEEVKAHCDLKILYSKNNLFQTESCLLTVALTVYEDNKAELNFIDLKDQLKIVAQLVKPSGVWSEDISNLKQVLIDSTSSKKNTTYILYQGYISPIDTGKYRIPSIPFRLLKYSIFKSPLEIKRKESELKIYTLPVTINSKPLPAKVFGKWCAGQFSMNEKISSDKIVSNKAFNYTITISQKGLSGIIPAPIILDNKNFNIFAPVVEEKMYRNKANYIGTKSFQYTIVPRGVGSFNLSQCFFWVYYNVAKNTIDTLKPFVKIEVTKSKEISLPIYETEEAKDWNEIINKSSNKVLHLESDPRLKWVSNVLIILMLLITLYIILKK